LGLGLMGMLLAIGRMRGTGALLSKRR
jgi:hypothetical protein